MEKRVITSYIKNGNTANVLIATKLEHGCKACNRFHKDEIGYIIENTRIIDLLDGGFNDLAIQLIEGNEN